MPTKYNANSLYRIRAVIGSQKPSHDVLSVLKELNILRYRGRRAGARVQRSIPVVSNRKVNTERNHGQGVCKKNLIYPAMQPISATTYVNIASQNVRSITNKSAAIQNIITANNIQICALTESWHSSGDNVALNSITPPGYYYIEKAREVTSAESQVNHGGVVLILHSSIRSKNMSLSLNIKSFEFICCRILSPSRDFIVVAIYRPGSKVATKQFFDDLTSLLEVLTPLGLSILLTGDVNIRMERENDLNTKRMNELLHTFCLMQHVHESTHDLGGVLDLVITGCDDHVSDLYVTPNGISDHYQITWRYNHIHITSSKTIVVRQWRDMDTDSFNHDLSSSILCDYSVPLDDMSLDDICSLYHNTLENLLDSHSPNKEITINNRHINSPWFNAECRAAKKCALSLKRQFYASKLVDDKSMWIEALKSAVRVYEVAKDQYWRDKLATQSGNPKKLWGSLNNILGRQATSENFEIKPDEFQQFCANKLVEVTISTQSAPPPVILPTAVSSFTTFQPLSTADIKTLIMRAPSKQCSLDPAPTWIVKSCVELLGPFLMYICNRSLTDGYVPLSQKAALVTPLLKKPGSDKSEVKNYRPISNLSFVSKLMERCASHQLTSYLSTNKLIPCHQSAYRANHSTETALLKVYSDFVDAFDKGEITLLCMLDMSAAFDTVDHQILLERLEKTHGIEDGALEWLKSYLSDRVQTVVCGNNTSSVSEVDRGVPQGSVLGPLLFLLYTVDINKIIQSHGLHDHAYADDNQIYFHAPRDQIDFFVTRLLNCINEISDWMSSNRLRLNPDKTELIWFVTPHQSDAVLTSHLSVGSASIIPSTTVRNLGVVFDKQLNFSAHTSNVVRSCFYQLRQLGRVKRSMSREQLKMLLHAFISSRLDYCNSLLAGQPICLIKRFQTVQNAAARMYAGLSRSASITPVLRDDLHWLKIPYRITYKLCVTVYKCLHGLAPQYLTDYCVRLSVTQTRTSRNRSANAGNLVVPRTRLKTYGQRSFAVSGPTAWNSLPVHLKNEQSFSLFKSELKTHLFNLCYN